MFAVSPAALKNFPSPMLKLSEILRKSDDVTVGTTLR